MAMDGRDLRLHLGIMTGGMTGEIGQLMSANSENESESAIGKGIENAPGDSGTSVIDRTSAIGIGIGIDRWNGTRGMTDIVGMKGIYRVDVLIAGREVLDGYDLRLGDGHLRLQCVMRGPFLDLDHLQWQHGIVPLERRGRCAVPLRPQELSPHFRNLAQVWA